MIEGTVVKSVAGHDQNRFYVITKIEPGFVWIADGRLRKLEKPKRKNILHIKKTNTALSLEKISTDKKLREALRPFNEALCGAPQQGGF
ncbi:KOW domain-containing RNA-binding protein [Oscillospiraceae bacterium MB08-C2-2]|nr:KOW domain-containing RNA-binding protein [Oscillospiraceae bacterium MB08-C2-2]